LKLAYNWYFEINKDSQESGHRVFRVPDFVGDACKAIASRVRGAVAAVSFDRFHRNSSEIIISAVFGIDPESNVTRNKFYFSANNLVITNIDIQSVEPVDQRTRDALQKSVQLAIEITTKSQEASARHEAERIEQEAKGRLERQKIHDEAEAENPKRSCCPSRLSQPLLKQLVKQLLRLKLALKLLKLKVRLQLPNLN